MFDSPGAARSTESEPAGCCPLCDGDQCQEMFRKDGLPILRCPDCNLAFSTHEPEEGTLSELYGESYFTAGGSGYRSYVGEAEAHRHQARIYLRRLAGHVSGGTLLDVGCAAGFFLEEARKAGWTVTGLDPSPYASGYARKTFGFEVINAGFLEADFGDRRFDLITMFNVLEHMADPLAVERRLFELSSQGGTLAIETWDARSTVARLLGRRWQQFDPTYVPYYYSPASLKRLFPPPRWKTEYLGGAAKWISLRRGLEIVADRGGRGRHALHRMAGTAVARLKLPYRTGELLFAVFSRRNSFNPVEGAGSH